MSAMRGRWAVGGALLCAGLLAAACSSEVTVLGGSSGAGASGSGVSATSGANSGSGASGANSMTACSGNGQCEIADRSCCGVCGIPELTDVTAINKAYRDAYVDDLCSDSDDGCPECEQAPNGNLFAYCSQSGSAPGRCVAADVRDSELSQCTVDSDCRLRMGLGCCEACSGGYNDVVAINTKLQAELRELVCDEDLDIGCPLCAPQYPEGTFAVCYQGQCAVESFDEGG